MRSIAKLMMTAVVVMAGFVAFTGSASAASASIAPGGQITAQSLGRLTFEGGIITPECNVSLIGTLTRNLIDKTLGTPIGSITNAQITNCANIDTAVVLDLPWSLQYVSIDGTLPNDVDSVRIRIVTAQFELQGLPIFGGNCLMAGNAEAVIDLTSIGGGRYTTGLIPSQMTPPSELVRGSPLCPDSGYLRGTFALTPQQTLTRLPD